MISVVMPVYNEGEHIFENVSKVRRVLTAANVPSQFVLIDDGSRDNTWNEIERLYATFGNISMLMLSRRFGKEAALCAGLANATGDAVVVMDSDLQHPPELIPEMVRLWHEEGYDVVEGVKADRGKEGIFSRLAASTFYRVFSRLTDIDMGSASDFKLLDRRVIEDWKRLGETNTFFRGMSAWVGYRRYELPFEVAERTGGTSKWSFGSLTGLALNAIVSYTAVPLGIVTSIGALFSAGAIVLFAQTLYMWMTGRAVTGFTTVILLLLAVGGAVLVSLGVIGVYISKIYDEVKGRPRYLIAERAGDGVMGTDG